MRANAALRLAEFGTLFIPRTAKQEADVPTPPRNAKNNPYFILAAAQLSTALYLESKTEIREAIKKALNQMTAFAKEEKQQLLCALIKQLVDANRTAKVAFIEALAHYSALMTQSDANLTSSENDIDVNFVASVAPFCDKPKATVICLRALMNDGQRNVENSDFEIESIYTISRRIYHMAQNGLTEEKGKSLSLSISTLKTSFQQLSATANVLVSAICALEFPSDKPIKDSGDETDAEESSEFFDELCKWRRLPEIDLSECFIPNSYIRRASLDGCNLSYTYLINSTFDTCWLDRANLQGSRLDYSSFFMSWARAADFGGASMSFSYLRIMNLQNSTLNFVRLTDSSIEQCDMRGANLNDSNLRGTLLYDVEFQKIADETFRETVFPDDLLSKVKFETKYELHKAEGSEERTEQLKRWLESLDST